jgi:ribosomal protein S18 acetylase RimI-like enzyme
MENLTLRPYAGDADIPVMVDIQNREMAAAHVPYVEEVAHTRARYSVPSKYFDPARDVTIAEVDGVPVGFGDRSWVDTTLQPPLREYRMSGAVLPEWQRKGIGTALLHNSQAKARELDAAFPTDLPRVFGSWCSDRQAGTLALLQADGFEKVRDFFEMARPLSEPIADVHVPDGLEIRPLRHDEMRKVWDADVEAFQDHWGGFESSEESYQRWLAEPDRDTALWVIIFDGEVIAGGSINAIPKEENKKLGVKRGWLHNVWTGRNYRRRGVARAAVNQTLKLMKNRGLDTGMLGVDATNPTGALALYEDVGFSVVERAMAWRKTFTSEAGSGALRAGDR